MTRRKSIGAKRRSGVILIVTILAMTVLIGIVALAVDLGRYQVVETQLLRTCEAAARAGVANLSSGTTTSTTAAKNLAALDIADGTYVNSSNATITIQYLNWTSSSNYTIESGATGSNAMKVTISESVPMLFAEILGFPKLTATESATALITTYTETPYVNATGNPWLAGEPNGTEASQPDPGYFDVPQPSDHKWEYDTAGPNGTDNPTTGEPYGTPVQLTIPVTPGSTIELTNVTGLASNDYAWAANTDANGDDGGTYYNYNDAAATNGDGDDPGYTGTGNANSASDATGSEHGMSNTDMPLNSIVGVFLDANQPDTEDSTVPPGLDFTTQSERDYSSISPELRQTFYAGNGQTSTGAQQEIVVPAGATRMFLGTMDGWEWSNNTGGFTVTITETSISIVQ